FGFGLVIVLMGLMLLTGLNALGSVVRMYEDEALRIAENVLLAEQIERHFTVQRYSTRAYVNEGDPTARAEYEAAKEAAYAAIARLGERVQTHEGEALVEAVAASQAAYAEAAERMLGGGAMNSV